MIGIVGGGLTGLVLAHELTRRGVEHVVLEAADRPGGVIRSERDHGRVLEHGPQRARMTAGMAALVAELGLTGRVVTAPPGLPLYVYAQGALREVPGSLGKLLAGDLLSWPGKLRLLLEPLTVGARDTERVATFFTRKLGRQAYERIAGPLYGGLYASDPADMVVGHSLSALLRELGVGRSLLWPLVRRGGTLAPPPSFSFPDGLQTLTDTLYGTLAGSVRLGTRVEGIGSAERRWILEAEGVQVEAEDVVLTCDAPSAARLLVGVAPAAAERLRSLVYNPLAIVHLHAPAAGLHGLGYQVALGEELATRGVTWNESQFGREGLHTAFLGGARHPALLDQPDADLGALAASEFARVTGRAATVLSTRRARMPAWDASWAALAGLELPTGIHVAANWRSRPGIPGRLADAKRLGESLAVSGRKQAP